MTQAIRYLPEAEADELIFLQKIFDGLTESQAQFYASLYRARRRDPMLILVCTLIGFAGIAGIQRIITRQIGMGILNLFTAGLCFIGTIIDAVNYRQLTSDYNQRIAFEVLSMLKSYQID